MFDPQTQILIPSDGMFEQYGPRADYSINATLYIDKLSLGSYPEDSVEDFLLSGCGFYRFLPPLILTPTISIDDKWLNINQAIGTIECRTCLLLFKVSKKNIHLVDIN